MIDLSKISISLMTLSDLDEVKNVLSSEFDDFWKYEIFKEELVNNNSKYLILRYNNEIISFGGIKIILDEANLMDIVTKKDKRRSRVCKITFKRINQLIKR